MNDLDKYGMRKWIDIISEATLLEGRDAYLFHGTDLVSAIQILKTNSLEGTQQYEHNPLGVSLTRDYRIARDFGTYWERQFPVVFVLDQQKLVRSRHKLLPRRDTYDSGTRAPDEAEEMVLGNLSPLSSFLISVNVHPAHLREALRDEEYHDWMNDEYGVAPEELIAGIKALASHPLLNAWLPRVQWTKGAEQVPLHETQASSLLFHGTSLVQYEKMRANGFMVQNLYLGESTENITDHYAEEQARKDSSYPVTIVIDASALSGVMDDIHQGIGELIPQAGQFIYSGPLKQAIIRAFAVDDDGEEVPLPIGDEPLPLLEAAIPPTPYGYWITDLGEFVPVPHEAHDAIARFQFGKDTGQVLDEGWIRVVVEGAASVSAYFHTHRLGIRAISALRRLTLTEDFRFFYLDVRGSEWISKRYTSLSPFLSEVSSWGKKAPTPELTESDE